MLVITRGYFQFLWINSPGVAGSTPEASLGPTGLDHCLVGDDPSGAAATNPAVAAPWQCVVGSDGSWMG